LAANHDIYLLAFFESSYDRDKVLDLDDIFKDVYLIKKKKKKRSVFRYLRNTMSLWPNSLMKDQYPDDYLRFKDKMSDLILSKKIDLLYCHLIRTAEFALDVRKCVKILHLIDSNTLRVRREVSLQNTWELIRNFRNTLIGYKLKAFEQMIIKYFDLSIVVGKKDYEVLKALSPDANVALIPNGVDTAYFNKLPENISEYPVLTFFGKISTPPNVDAVKYFYHSIFPIIRAKIPGIRFHIVGSSPTDEIKKLTEDENVVVTGYVEDIRTYIAKADVVICPMRKGGGIKNKILEAMSLGRAVVSTSIGAEGVDVTNGQDILISDTPAEFAESINRILSDKCLRDRVVTNARKLIDNNYSWDICANKYIKLFEDLKNTKELND
jgi:glycosyltransferase involved in cell wall biosynthesis